MGGIAKSMSRGRGRREKERGRRVAKRKSPPSENGRSSLIRAGEEELKKNAFLSTEVKSLKKEGEKDGKQSMHERKEEARIIERMRKSRTTGEKT